MLPTKLEPTTASAPPATSVDQAIRKVDFRNGFTYDTGDFGTFTVTNGQGARGTMQSPDFASFTVVDVDYGDLDGNGKEYAAVRTEIWTGGTGRFSSVWVYLPSGPSADVVARTPLGDRGDGGVADSRVIDGALVVDNNDLPQGACCPTAVTRHTYKLTGTTLTEVSAPETTALAHIGATPTVIGFLPGTTSAVLRADLSVLSVGTLDASASQRLVAKSRNGSLNLVLRSGEQIVSQGTALDVVLAATGTYRMEVAATPAAPADALIDLSIT